MQKPIIECKDISKVYGKGKAAVRALRDITLSIYENELFMIVGPSGSGKTTLISIISTLLSPTSGECRVLGFDITKMSPSQKDEFRLNYIGFVFQAFNLLAPLSAAENVAVPLFIKNIKRDTALKKAKTILQEVYLDRFNALPSKLSGGEKQRVAIARALINEPKLIICDEPTSNLDSHTGKKVMQILKNLAKREGSSVIVVTHDSRIFEYADRIAHIEDGMIKEVG